MRILLLLITLIAISLATLQFSGITDLDDPKLIREVQSQLLEEYREQSASSFSESLKNDSLGKIINQAANLITTQVTLFSTQQSQSLFSDMVRNPVTIVHAQYLVENSSEEPLEDQSYLKFSKQNFNNWTYVGKSNATEFYLNFLSF